MTDSDDTMSFARTMPVGDGSDGPGSALKRTSAAMDPVLSLCRDLVVARGCAQKLTYRQQAIESVMMEQIGFPSVRVELHEGGHVCAVAPEDVGDLLDHEREGFELAPAAIAEFAAHRARWAAADAELGYSAALRAEGRALQRVRDLAGRLWATPATSLAGVIAKLDAVLEEGALSAGARDLPWPQLRAIRADLERLHVAAPTSFRR